MLWATGNRRRHPMAQLRADPIVLAFTPNWIQNWPGYGSVFSTWPSGKMKKPPGDGKESFFIESRTIQKWGQIIGSSARHASLQTLFNVPRLLSLLHLLWNRHVLLVQNPGTTLGWKPFPPATCLLSCATQLPFVFPRVGLALSSPTPGPEHYMPSLWRDPYGSVDKN